MKKGLVHAFVKKVMLLMWPLLLVACNPQDELKESVEIKSDVGSIHVDPGNFAGNELVLGVPVIRTVTLTNEGKLTATGINFVFPQESVFSIIDGTNNCESTLQSGEQCSLRVEARPEAAGLLRDRFYVRYNNGVDSDSSVVVLEALIGEIATLQVYDVTDLNFGVVETGSTENRVVRIQNIGGLSARNIAFNARLGDSEIDFAGGSYPGTGGTCSDVIGPGEICNIVFSFYGASVQTYAAIFSLSYTAPFDNATFDVSVTGISDAVIARIVAPAVTTYDFGQVGVGNYLEATETISNFGYLDATNLSFGSTGPFSYISDTCPSTLEVSESCTVTFRYTASTSGVETGTIDINYNNGVVNTVYNMNVSGTGIPPAHFDILDDSFLAFPTIDLGVVANLAPNPFIIYLVNTGSVSATSFSISSLPPNLSVTSTTCGSEVAAAASCQYVFSYSPTSTGIVNDNIVFSYHNGTTNFNQTTPFVADSQNLAILNYDQGLRYNFGTVIVEDVDPTQTITVSNDGQVAATGITFSGAIAPYSVSGGTCPLVSFDLPAGSSCTLDITYAPVANGFTNWPLIASYHNGNAADTSRIDIDGDAVHAAILSMTAGAVYDFGAVSTSGPRYANITLENTGDLTATINSALLTTAAEIDYRTGTYPGFLTPPTNACGSTLAAGSTCTLSMVFNPTAYILYSDTMTVNYNDGLTTQNLVFNIQGTGGDLAYLTFSPSNISFGNVAIGGFSILTMTVNNIGTEPASAISITNVSAPFSIDSETCTGGIAEGGSCTVNFRFDPPLLTTYLDDNITFDYNDGVNSRFQSISLDGIGVNPANLNVLGVSDPINDPLDFDLEVVGTTKQLTFSFRNTGGVDATGVVFSGVAAPFVISSNSCGATIASGAFCVITIDYTPTTIGILDTDAMQVDYFDGAAAQVFLYNMQGMGEPPLHHHQGWREIFAIGDKVNSIGISGTDRKVSLAWNAMIPDASTITGYEIYRRSPSGTYDFLTPVGSTAGAGANSFTDTTVANATAYYYTVRPIISGAPSRAYEDYSEIRVVVPPQNMALVHRRMANKTICEEMGRVPNRSSNNSCGYLAVGSSGSVYDIGYDFLMDRFEMGMDGTSRHGQMPIQITQNTAWGYCDNQGTQNIFELGAYTKILPSRKEHFVAAQWPASLSDTDVANLEMGLTVTSDCNGNGSNYELTGSNTNCVSRFGLMDMAGNSWEWTSDRVFEGIGTPDIYRLDPDNHDLDGIDFSYHVDNDMAAEACISYALGLIHPQSGGACLDNAEPLSTYAVTRFNNDYYYAPDPGDMGFSAVGGSYNATTTQSGIFSWAFVPYNYGVGARCIIRL